MYLRLGLSTAVLLTGIGFAAAQQPAAQQPAAQQPAAQQPLASDAQQKRHDQMLQTVPGKNGKEEPSSHLDTSSDTRVFVDGKLNVPGAAQDGHTVPAKFSSHNAEIDAVSLMARPLDLTDAQKHRIADSVAKANSPVEAIDAKPADMLAVTTPTTELSSEITAAIPAVKDFKVVRTRDKILLVSANNMVVRDVIAN